MCIRDRTNIIGSGEDARNSIIYLVLKWAFIAAAVISTLVIINNWLFRDCLLYTSEEFQFEVPSPELKLNVDRTQIEQILINLLKNAREACSRKSDKKIQRCV